MKPGDSPPASSGNEPLVIHFGKQRKRRIKQLTKGEGRLFEELTQSIKELQASGTVAPNVQPIIVVVKEKRKRTGLWG
jgi:hypothetical protein